MSPFQLETCARSNILKLKPYRCARDDYKDDGTNVLLDANENAFGPSLDLQGSSIGPTGVHNGNAHDLDLLHLHRYPDPHQVELKGLLCNLRNTHHHTAKKLTHENLCVGVGSDEIIDALIRCFCSPGQDKILTCPPTYGMYPVSAQVNDVEVLQVPADAENRFRLRPASINSVLATDANIKLVFLCSPGNPSATLVSKSELAEILNHPTWNGVVVVDEAYIDFSPEGSSLAEWVTEWPNLVVMQTLSKAFGLAGIRLGAAFTSPPIAQLLNSLKAPYNISSPTSALACAALQPQNVAIMKQHREKILQQKQRLLRELPKIPGVGKFVGGEDANFLLVEMLDRPLDEGGRPSNETALAVYARLAEMKGVVVRFRGKEVGCEGCLRITVGTEEEVNRLTSKLRDAWREVFDDRRKIGKEKDEEREECEANGIIA